MLKAFISGPYRAKTTNETRRNIRIAEEAAEEYWRKGYAVICPHLNSAFFDGACDDERFLIGYEEMVPWADLVVLLPGWETSAGARREYERALSLGIKTEPYNSTKTEEPKKERG